jgi:hypothetical protein
MDKDLALLILSSCYRSTRDLANISTLAAQHCHSHDAKALRTAVANATYDIMENIAKYVAQRCPEAQAEVEGRLAKYEQAF